MVEQWENKIYINARNSILGTREWSLVAPEHVVAQSSGQVLRGGAVRLQAHEPQGQAGRQRVALALAGVLHLRARWPSYNYSIVNNKQLK